MLLTNCVNYLEGRNKTVAQRNMDKEQPGVHCVERVEQKHLLFETAHMRSRVTAVGRVIGGGLNQGEFVVCFPVGTRHFTLLQIFEAGPFILYVLGGRLPRR